MTPRPLAGVRVVVTRRAEQAGGLVALLKERGAVPLSAPVIKVAPPPTWGPVDDAIGDLATGAFEWVLFTSTNAVEAFCGRLTDLGALRAIRIGAVGGATKAALEERGLVPSLVPERATGEDLAEALGAGGGRSVLLPRAAEVPPAITDVLEDAGWFPRPVAVYRTVAVVPEGGVAAHVRSKRFDAVTFTSGSTVRAFTSAFGEPANLSLDDAAAEPKAVVCIGPVTAAACAEEGLRVDAVADRASDEGLVAALEGHLA